MSSLEHHGIKGQKWGVRRFQNKDGSRTAEGKKRYKTIQAVHGAYKEPNYAEKEQHAYDDASKRVFDAVAKADQALQDRFKETDLGKKNPNAIPHIDGYTTGDISSPFSKSIEKQIYDWIRKQDDLREPIREAEEIRSKAESKLRKKVEHTSMMENTNYIYGNTLVLGDPLYLEHHGIKGQRWGLRRFQNSDGSLTDAGRKRYGIVSGAKKAASMVGAGAKKTFDAGKKAATVIKAHREKAAEEKKAKLKEKASKSRLGVLANKDLFTADEMRKLNERFKIEDEMTMASLKKGAEVVSNIATIARGVRDVNSAVEEITGKTINPFKKSKNEADLRKAEAQAKKAEAAADKERSEADKAARDNTKDTESKAKQEKESAAKEKEAATEKKASDNANKEIDDIKADTAKKAADISSKYDSPKKDGLKGLPEHTPAPKAKENEELSRTIKDVASKLDSGRMVLGRDKQAESNAANTPKLPGPTIKDHFNADSPAFKQLSAAISAANANKSSNVKAPKAKNIDVPDEYKPGAKKPKSNEELSKSLNELTKMAAKNLDTAKDKKSDPSSTSSKILEKNKKTLDNLKSDDGLANAIGEIFKPKEKRPANKAKIEALSKKVKNTKDPKLREKYIKDLANEATRLDMDDFEKFANGTLFKHSALSSDELAHYGVLGMKWGKHIMAGKGLLPKLESSGGGGGGAPEEEEDEENKIDPNYSRDKNKLPGKKHLDKATEYANKAAADRAKAQAEEAKMHKAQAEAASLDRKVKGASFWNDRDGYFVSKQRPADKKRVKQLRVEAKEHRQASKRYSSSAGSNAAKSGKEYKKWIKTPSGLYDNAMKHDFFIEDGTLYLEHHGIKGQRWGVRRFQNPDGTLTDKGRKHYQKKLDREKRKQVSSDNLRGTLERQHGLAVGATGVLSAIGGALTVAALVSNPATIAAGAAISAAVSAGLMHGSYSIAEAWEGRGSGIRKKRIAKYENMLKQDAFFVEDGMLHLEHFGIKNMKWGIRRFQNKDGSLTDAGKKRYSKAGENVVGGGGGGAPEEEDEETKKKIEEAAKKAGMTVDEFRKKFANKVAAIKKAAYDAAGGKYKDAADKYDTKAKSNRNLASEYKKASLDSYAMGMAYDQAAKRRYAASEARKEAVKNEKPINYEHPGYTSVFPEEEARQVAQARWNIKYYGTPAFYDGYLARKKTKTRWMQEYADAAKKDFDDWASGKAEPTDRASTYWYHRERAATLRRKHSGTIGSGDKRIGDAYKEEAARQRETGSAQARKASSYNDKANESSKKARSYRKKYEKSLLGRYDRMKSKIEQKRKGRTDQYIAGPEQNKNTKHLLDTEYSKSLRRGAERKSRDAAIFGKAADEVKRKQASALGKGLKAKADYYGKQVDFIEKTSSEKIMGRRDWKGNLRDSEPYTSVRDSKRAYDKTAQGKLDKARYAVQRTKQRVKNTLEARGSSQIPTKNSSPDQSPTNRPVSREKTKRAVKGSIKVGERRHRSTTSQQGIKQGEKHEGLRTHTLPKMKSLTATAKPMRKLTSKELSKIRSEAKKRRK